MTTFILFLGSGLFKFFFLILSIIISLLIMFIPSCSNEERTTNILIHRGYTDIKILDKHWWACDYGDYSNTAFKAKLLNGVYVKGSICDGIFKDKPEIKFDDE